MAQVGSLAVRVSANTTPFNRGMAGTRSATRRFQGRVGDMDSRLGRMRRTLNDVSGRTLKMTGVLGGAAAGFAYMADQSLQANQRLLKLSRQTGFSITRIQELEYAARQAGVAQDVLRDAMAEMTQRMGEAEADFRNSGGKVTEMGEGFREAGVAIDGLSGRNPDKIFNRMASAISNADTESQALNIAVKTFGDEAGRDMVAMLRDGTGRLDEMAEEARRLGLVLSDETVRGGAEAARAVDQLKQVLSAQFQRVIADLGPDITEFTNAIAENPQAIREFAGHVQTLAEVMGTLAKETAEAIEYWSTSELEQASAEYEKLAQKQERLTDNLQRLEEEGGGPPQLIENLRDELDVVTERADAAKKRLDNLYEAGQRDVGGGRSAEDGKSGGGGGEGDRTAEAAQQVGAKASSGEQKQRAGEEKAYREHLQRKLQAFDEYAASRREREVMQYEQRRKMLLNNWEQELITEKEFRTRVQQLEDKHQQKLTEIERRGLSAREKFQRSSMRTQVGTVAGEMENMTASVSQENRAMFEANKAAGIANAIVNTWTGVSKSLAAYPQPLASVMAAAHLASGLAAVNKIRSQSFGGGGGGGGGGAATQAPSESGGQSTQEGTGAGEQGGADRTISIQGMGAGDLLTKDMVAELAQGIEEAAGDGRTRIRVD